MGHVGKEWDGMGWEWGGSSRDGVGHTGVGWVMQGWGGSCRGGVGHVGVGCVMQGWGRSCRGGVGVGHAGMWWGGVCHALVGWVM